MADVKISDLPAGTIAGGELVPMVQAGITKAGTLGAAAAAALPLALASGGTGSSFASAAALRAGLGILGSVTAQFFTANGTYTPSSGMVACLVIATGGGGGAGGSACAAFVTGPSLAAGGPGGAGGTCIELFTAAQIGASQVVTIGTGGSGGNNTGTDGTTGGNTTLGSLFNARGGDGGIGVSVGDGETGFGSPGEGDSGINGLINLAGGGGTRNISTGVGTIRGLGGVAFWGPDPTYPTNVFDSEDVSEAGINAVNYGNGGIAGLVQNVSSTQTNQAGGNGKAGCMLILEFRAA
jgi:hypothetical protein